MPQTLVILYDADCRLCQAAKEQLESVDKEQQLRFIPFQDPQVTREFPSLHPNALQRDIHVVLPDGSVYTGAAGYREIGRVISTQSLRGKLMRLSSLLMRIPGTLPLAELVYGQIAKNRYRFRTTQHHSTFHHCCALTPKD